MAAVAADVCKFGPRGTERRERVSARERERRREGKGGGKERARESGAKEGAKDGERGDVCTLKYYSQMKYRVGPGGTARVYF